MKMRILATSLNFQTYMHSPLQKSNNLWGALAMIIKVSKNTKKWK